MNRSAVKLAPSILAADFGRLADEIKQAEQAGADRIHIDVMDGRFVPNISIGLPIVQAAHRATKLPLETHLMIEDPDRYLEAFAQAGSDSLLVHVEGGLHLHRTMQRIKALGKRSGVVLNPATPVAALEEILREVDLVLVMTVNPGFGGQGFIHSTVSKIGRIRELIDRQGLACELEVDGGIDATTAPLVVAAGARILVAGSAIFGAKDGVLAASRRLQAAGEAALP